MADHYTRTPLARSAIEPAPPARVEHGWQVSGRRSTAALRLTDCSPLAKTLVRADERGPVAAAVGVSMGTARSGSDAVLTAGTAPGEWLVLGPPGRVAERARLLATVPDDGLVTVVDMTHGLTLIRVSGPTSAALLSKLCPVDLHDSVTPNGTALRSLMAGVPAGVVRDDHLDERRYLVFGERAVGQYLFDAIFDAGPEFAVDVDGFRLARLRLRHRCP